ncbi:MAG: alginate export family protein [Thermodesulfovibrionales bacterium]|nr:alginate export family protein [Thermodesulfovibrionales bacterium]
MKKYLALALGVLFTLGFAASAFAIHAEIPAETQAIVAKGTTQITLGGELRFRGAIKANTADFNDAASSTSDTSTYDGRVRLRIQADVSKNTMGVIHLETGSNTGDTYTWGDSTAMEAQGVYAEGNGKRGTMAVLEAWVQHKFNIGVPAGIKVGHMPLALGNGLFFNHAKFGDDAIVLFFDPTKELHIGLLDIKLNEGVTGSPDDTDAYVALFSYKSKSFNMSGDITHLIDQDYNSKGLAMTNYGLRADTKVGPVGLKADVELQKGTSKPDTGADTNFKGYAYLLGANYKAGDFTLDLEYAVGSGDNNSSDNKVGTFVTALANTQKYTYVYDYLTRTAGVTAPSAGASALGAANTGIANTTFIKLGASGDVTKNLNLIANYYILRATKAVSTSGTYNSKKIGSELDAKITYKLDKNLVYFVEGGYLWAGEFFKNITASAKSPDDAYSVRHGITLSF